MYALDNDSGVTVMPAVKNQRFAPTAPRWFTEGGNGVAPSYPGADWFNIVQAELLHILTDGRITPAKGQHNQITLAIKAIVSNTVNASLNHKANIASPTFTGTPKAPTPAQTVNDTTIATTAYVRAAIAALVGSAPATLDTLAEIANALAGDANVKATLLAEIGKKANATHTHTMAQVDGLNAALNTKAPLASPTFTGAPKAPTPAQTVNDTTIATTAYVRAAIAALVGSAPATLDTLAEIANALAGDANVKTTLLAEIGKKANASHTHTMAQITDFELKALNTEDLNTVKKAGFYAQGSNANCTAARNYPETQAGSLEVRNSTYGWQQEYTVFSNGHKYVRNTTSNAGNFGAWHRIDALDLTDLFVGVPIPYPLSAVPAGCLAMNGQRFDKARYPKLGQKYPSGVLSDLRAEWIRGWDNGRGVDAGRALLSAQGDAIKTHTIDVPDSGAPGNNMGIWYYGERGGAANNGHNQVTYNGANETRPRNIAFQYICLAA